MDPYLEGHLWHDVHGGLARTIQELLAHQIAPKYVARVEVYTAKDKHPESEIGITYPDAGVLLHGGQVPTKTKYGPAWCNRPCPYFPCRPKVPTPTRCCRSKPPST